jgi:regulator of replication initiation timing
MSGNDTAAADVSGLVERLSRSIDRCDILALWATIQTLSESNAALEAENARLRACLAEAMYALIECEEYFDNRADADHDGIGFVANEEMKLQVMIRRVREGGK